MESGVRADPSGLEAASYGAHHTPSCYLHRPFGVVSYLLSALKASLMPHHSADER